MRNHDLAKGAGLAGALLLAMPAFELLLGAGGVGPVHLVVGSFGLVLLGVSAANAIRGA